MVMIPDCSGAGYSAESDRKDRIRLVWHVFLDEGGEKDLDLIGDARQQAEALSFLICAINSGELAYNSAEEKEVDLTDLMQKLGRLLQKIDLEDAAAVGGVLYERNGYRSALAVVNGGIKVTWPRPDFVKQKKKPAHSELDKTIFYSVHPIALVDVNDVQEDWDGDAHGLEMPTGYTDLPLIDAPTVSVDTGWAALKKAVDGNAGK